MAAESHIRTTTLLTANGVPSKKSSGHSTTWLTGGNSMARQRSAAAVLRVGPGLEPGKGERRET